MSLRIFLFLLISLITVSGMSADQLKGTKSGTLIAYGSAMDRNMLISFAKKYLGTPYRSGGNSPKRGFDCSGFVNFVFGNFQIRLPRSSRDFKDLGTDLKPEEFKEGDVIVFKSFKNKTRIGHVGIICEANGMQSKFIHSSSGHKTGIVVSNLGSPNYAKRFYRCIDVIGTK